MKSTNFLVGVLFCCIGYVLSANDLSCKVKLQGKEADLKVQYDRKNIGIYKHFDVHLVNVLVPLVKVTYQIKNVANSGPSLETTIEGLATLTKGNTLEACDLVLRTKDSKDFPRSTQRELFASAKSCVESKLCVQVGKVTVDDERRATQKQYDFGENSLYYNLMSQRYPKLQLEKRSRQAHGSGLPGGDKLVQSSLNSLVDFLIVSSVSAMSGSNLGTIALPDEHIEFADSKEHYLSMSDGSLGDLTNIMRTEDVKLSNDGFRYTLSFGLQLPKVVIRYNNYKIKYPPGHKSGSATISLDSIAVSAQIVVNYNTNPCEISADYVRTRIDEPTFELSGGNWIVDNVVNTAVKLAIKMFTSKILDTIKTLVVDHAAEAMHGLDCEIFRPRLH